MADEILYDEPLKYQPLSRREIVIIDKDQFERLKSANDELHSALKSIERQASLSADPGRAHSAQISYDELLSGFRTIAAMARLARIKANTD